MDNVALRKNGAETPSNLGGLLIPDQLYLVGQQSFKVERFGRSPDVTPNRFAIYDKVNPLLRVPEDLAPHIAVLAQERHRLSRTSLIDYKQLYPEDTTDYANLKLFDRNGIQRTSNASQMPEFHKRVTETLACPAEVLCGAHGASPYYYWTLHDVNKLPENGLDPFVIIQPVEAFSGQVEEVLQLPASSIEWNIRRFVVYTDHMFPIDNNPNNSDLVVALLKNLRAHKKEIQPGKNSLMLVEIVYPGLPNIGSIQRNVAATVPVYTDFRGTPSNYERMNGTDYPLCRTLVAI